MHTRVSVIPSAAHTHARHTHTNNNALYWTQTSVTSLPPEFTRNQLRLSKKGEAYPPPLNSCQHSCSYSFLLLLYSHDSISNPKTYSLMHIFFLHQHKEETNTLLFLALNSPIPSCSSYSLPLLFSFSLTHNNKIPSAAISHQLHAWGVASQRRPRNKDTQSVVVGASVCQSHLHSTVFQPASFKRSSEGRAAVKVWCAARRRRGSTKRVCWWLTLKKAQRHESCALNQVHKEWMYGRNEQRQLAERSIPWFACFIPLTSNLYTSHGF